MIVNSRPAWKIRRLPSGPTSMSSMMENSPGPSPGRPIDLRNLPARSKTRISAGKAGVLT